MLEVLDRDEALPTRLDGREVVDQVLRGIQDACSELGRRYDIEKIQYLEGDSPPAETYRWLASKLIHRIDATRPRP